MANSLPILWQPDGHEFAKATKMVLDMFSNKRITDEGSGWPSVALVTGPTPASSNGRAPAAEEQRGG